MSTGGPPISFSGLGSGLDTGSIVTALMRLERAPIDRLQADRRGVEEERGVVQELNGLLARLRDAAGRLSAPDALTALRAESGDPAVVTADAAPGAAPGSYEISVTHLARAHTMASATAPGLTAGRELEIGVEGVTVSVAVEEGDDLAALAQRINAEPDAGVTAGVVGDRLVLVSGTSGAGGEITVGGTAAADLGLTTTQAARDALATINGVEVTSPTDVVEDAIGGVDLTLAGPGSATVAVGLDADAAEEDARAFVDAYNALISNVASATRYDAATGTAGTLQGDQTITSLASRARAIAGSAVDGLDASRDSLARIGITGSREGTLTLDADAFRAALAQDPAAVRAVLGRDDGDGVPGASDGIARRLSALAGSLSSDVLSARLTGYTASMGRLDDRIEGLERRMVLREERLRAQFTAMEQAIARLQGQGADLAARLGAAGL